MGTTKGAKSSINETAKSLSSEDLVKYMLIREKLKRFESDIISSAMVMRNCDLEIESITRKKQDEAARLRGFQQGKEQVFGEHTKFADELREKYKLPEGAKFGIDVDTGKIVIAETKEESTSEE